MELLLSLIIAAGLAFIPANMAKKKGYSFGLWWFYGWMLWIVAIIHVCIIPDKNAGQTPAAPNAPVNGAASVSEQNVAEELKKYKELLDSGILTQEEFDEKKARLLETL